MKASRNVHFKGDIKLNLAANKIRRLNEDAFASFHRILDLNLELNQAIFKRVYTIVILIFRSNLSTRKLSIM